ncbi:MAG: prolyl oligopeptidase family serine peptidase, partial [Flavobacteriaceae bacterium]|nr:prolyl oligopeptidase family serine peptidase [Flavobacteriaceae bacterium]
VLKISTNLKNEKSTINNVVEYKLDKINNTLSYITALEDSYTFGTVDLKTLENKVLYSGKNKLHDLIVSENGKGIFFLQEGKSFEETKLVYYKDEKSIIKIFNPQQITNFPIKYGIVTTKSIKISNDGKRIFFAIAKKPQFKNTNEDEVEVWDTEDAWIYPKAKKENIEEFSRLVVWFIDEGRFLQITDNTMPYVQLNGDKSVAMIYNPTAYTPHFKKYGDVDYYLYNIINGSKSLFLEKQPGENYLLSFSPDGKYICYFRGDSWWLYEIKSKIRIEIPAPKGTVWASSNIKYITRPSIYGMHGWSQNGKFFFLQDEFDVYRYDLQLKKLKKLTAGRENKKQYNIDESNKVILENENYNGWSSAIIDTSKDITLWSRNTTTKEQQYTVLTNSDKVIPLVSKSSKVDEMISSKNGIHSYREQSYTMPPRLVCDNAGKIRILYQSNRQQNKYNWGKSELITFFNSKGQKLEGLVFYPANYEKGKTYPMIVNVYSQIANSLYDYCFPTLYNETGFNAKHFVLKDYFVLLPDVYYYEGETGKSALDCVTAATNAVIATGMVDTKRIGLTGHSFGGYETNYIITQTNKFAAAVSGASVTDMTSWYFSNSKSLYIAESWRSEAQQWRMGKTFFEDKQVYLNNSPILFADKVNTPLLTWAGKKETNLPYEQSILFYNALRRAGKKNVLLLYPNDNHSIVIKQNQIDLSHRISDWFDHYLK